MSERLTYRLGFVYDTTKHKTKKARHDAMIQARHLFFTSEGRKQFAGVHVIGFWSNPDRKNTYMAREKNTDEPGQSLPDFYDTLHGARGALHQLAEVDEKEYVAWSRAIEIEKSTARKKSKTRRNAVSKKSKTLQPKNVAKAKRKKVNARAGRVRQAVRPQKPSSSRRRQAKARKTPKTVARTPRNRR